MKSKNDQKKYMKSKKVQKKYPEIFNSFVNMKEKDLPGVKNDIHKFCFEREGKFSFVSKENFSDYKLEEGCELEPGMIMYYEDHYGPWIWDGNVWIDLHDNN